VDVGTISAYWETNLALLRENPELDLYDPDWVIHTRSVERPPVKCVQPGELVNSLASNGCLIQGTVINSILSPGVCVERGAIVRDSVIMNDTTIKAGAEVDRCILDKEIEIGAGARVGVGDDDTPNQAEPGNLNTGITIVGKRARIPSGTVVGRNCRIDSNVMAADFEDLEIPAGATLTHRPG
jgi:glucose-1-phosphate adenylyltransferase